MSDFSRYSAARACPARSASWFSNYNTFITKYAQIAQQESNTRPRGGIANFLDRHSRREMHAKAKVVVVGASCLESTRILLNSGIANSSGVLGHYLHDQFYMTGSVVAIVPEARDGNGRAGGSNLAGLGFVQQLPRLGPEALPEVGALALESIHGGEGAVAIADVDALLLGVVAHVVRVVAKRERLRDLEGWAFEE